MHSLREGRSYLLQYLHMPPGKQETEGHLPDRCDGDVSTLVRYTEPARRGAGSAKGVPEWKGRASAFKAPRARWYGRRVRTSGREAARARRWRLRELRGRLRNEGEGGQKSDICDGGNDNGRNSGDCTNNSGNNNNNNKNCGSGSVRCPHSPGLLFCPWNRCLDERISQLHQRALAGDTGAEKALDSCAQACAWMRRCFPCCRDPSLAAGSSRSQRTGARLVLVCYCGLREHDVRLIKPGYVHQFPGLCRTPAFVLPVRPGVQVHELWQGAPRLPLHSILPMLPPSAGPGCCPRVVPVEAVSEQLPDIGVFIRAAMHQSYFTAQNLKLNQKAWENLEQREGCRRSSRAQRPPVSQGARALDAGRDGQDSPVEDTPCGPKGKSTASRNAPAGSAGVAVGVGGSRRMQQPVLKVVSETLCSVLILESVSVLRRFMKPHRSLRLPARQAILVPLAWALSFPPTPSCIRQHKQPRFCGLTLQKHTGSASVLPRQKAGAYSSRPWK